MWAATPLPTLSRWLLGWASLSSSHTHSAWRRFLCRPNNALSSGSCMQLPGLQSELLQMQPAPPGRGLRSTPRPARTQQRPCALPGRSPPCSVPISLRAALPGLEPHSYSRDTRERTCCGCLPCAPHPDLERPWQHPLETLEDHF